MTAVATAEASGTVPAIPMITVNHNLAITGNLADVDITISGKDVPAKTAQAFLGIMQEKGIALLKGEITTESLSAFLPLGDFRSGLFWSDKEKTPLLTAADPVSAVNAYFTQFKDSKRTTDAVKKMYRFLKKQGQQATPVLAVTPQPRPVETTSGKLATCDDEGPVPTVPETPRESPKYEPRKSRGNNFHSGHSWIDPEEVRVVEGAASADDAWKDYLEKYPTGTRTRNAVTSRWYLARSRERNAALAKKENQEKGNLARNFEAPPWTDDEREPIRTATSREEAFFKYREKFPTSTRSPDAIGRQFYEMHPDKRNPEKPWTDAEKKPILTSDILEEAVENYRKAFPDSIRTDAAIRREWYELRPEKRGIIPTGRKKGGTNKTPLKGTMREKYQIPFRTTDQQREYNNAVNLCKKYKKPYAEAVKLREADEAARLQRKNEKAAAASKVSPGRIAVRKVVPKNPEAPPVTSKSGYKIGDDVVHNGSKSSPFFGKVGRIEKITTTDKIEHLLLRFGTSSISLSSEFVVPVVRRAAAACPTS